MPNVLVNLQRVKSRKLSYPSQNLIYPLKDSNAPDTSCLVQRFVEQTCGSVAVKVVFCLELSMDIVESLLFRIIDLTGKIVVIPGL